MKGFVYILMMANDRYYIGSTTDLERRLEEHTKGKVISTKGYLPIECVFSQEYFDISQARTIEYKLKKLKRRDYIEKIIKDKRVKMAA